MPGDGVEQPDDPAQPLDHPGPARPRQRETGADRLLQLHHAVGDVPDGVGDVQPDRGGAVPGDGQAVPLFEEQRLAPLLADQLVAARVRGGGRGAGGGAAAGRQLLRQLGELPYERGRPERDVPQD
ncbi:hypothetical protein STANM309S_01492 [Streptomyces tanashiensis]